VKKAEEGVTACHRLGDELGSLKVNFRKGMNILSRKVPLTILQMSRKSAPQKIVMFRLALRVPEEQCPGLSVPLEIRLPDECRNLIQKIMFASSQGRGRLLVVRNHAY
jgi:hypothetical protein